MMDDLISRKSLLECAEYDDKGRLIIPYRKVKNAPTAFDKEKVIAEMNETKNIVEAKIKKAYVTRDEVSFYLNSGASDMEVEFIDIVEKGGIE